MRSHWKIVALLIGAIVLFGGIASAEPPPPPPIPRSHALAPMALGRVNPTVGKDYTQLTAPCRLYDSRSSTPLGNNAVRTISLAACPAIPTYATSLNASISAVSPTRAGFTRIWANGVVEPNQTVLQYGPYSNTTGAALTVSAIGLRVHNIGGPTGLVIDIAGYWSPSMYAEIYTGLPVTVWSSTSMITAAEPSTAGTAGAVRITFARSIQYCDLQASGEAPGVLATISQFGQPSNQAILYTSDRATGNPTSVFAYVSVHC